MNQSASEVVQRVTAKLSAHLDMRAEQLAQGMKAEHARGRGVAAGTLYHLHNPERLHRASAPGQPPAEDLGGLMASIGYTTQGHLVRDVGPGSKAGNPRRPNMLGAWLELGTRKMAPRPFMSTATTALKQQVKK